MIVRGRPLPNAGIPDLGAYAGERRRDDALAARLRRYRSIGTATGVLVMLLSLFTAAGGIFTSPRPVLFVVFGIILANVGIAFVRFSHGTGTRQRWIRKFASPVRMRLLLQQHGGVTRALLFADGEAVDAAQPRLTVPVAPDEKTAPGSPDPVECTVYFDPERGWPAVIETEQTVYWARV
jgi:hypothetical protein